MAMPTTETGSVSQKPIPQTTKHIAPVVWSIDSSKLSVEDVSKFQNIWNVLNVHSDEVLTASIFSPFDLGWLVPLDIGFKKKTRDNLAVITKEQWDKFSIPFKKNGIIISESASVRDKVNSLIQFAKKHKAKLIAVGPSTEKKKHFTSLGSFSENLIVASPIPVLIMGENAKLPQQIKRILFPTDFSRVSELNFRKVVQFAKNYDAEVILYHFFDSQSGPIMYGIPWGYEVNWLADYWKIQEEHKRTEAERWKAWAEKHNVKCRWVNDHKLGNLSERIIAATHEDEVDLLTVGIKRGPLRQVILGRNVRELIEKSICPVLALHATDEKKKLHS